MNTRYCTAGHKNEYTAIKPRFCAACGVDMNLAFAAVAVPQTASRPAQVAPSIPPARRQPHPAARRRAHEVEAVESEDQDGEDYYDKNEAQIQADELAAGLKGGFSFVIDDSDNKKFKFGDLPNIQKYVQDATAAAAPKKVKRARK